MPEGPLLNRPNPDHCKKQPEGLIWWMTAAVSSAPAALPRTICHNSCGSLAKKFATRFRPDVSGNSLAT